MSFFFMRGNPANAGGQPVPLRCPQCRQRGTFEVLGQDLAVPEAAPPVFLGHRRCPETTCQVHVFVAYRPASGLLPARVVVSYPAERVGFEAADIPEQIVSSFDEAITCHAQACYRAAAIMVRRTVEELCAAQGAAGDNLYERIESLGDAVILPPALMAGLQELRIFGNDAAHLESRAYDDIGKDEVELAMDVTKEILRGVYQAEGLVRRLQERRRKEAGD